MFQIYAVGQKFRIIQRSIESRDLKLKRIRLMEFCSQKKNLYYIYYIYIIIYIYMIFHINFELIK